MKPLKSVFRNIFIKSGICSLIFGSLVNVQNAQAASGITYTGRIFKGDVAIDTGTVVFDVWIKTDTGCALYHEQRSLSMAGSGGTYSFDIGDGSVVGDYYFSLPNTLVDIFDNKRTYSFTSGCAGNYTPLVPTEGRKMNVQFTPPGDSTQVLPELVINPVPFALFANKANQVVGTVAIANGGTGAATKAAGFNALSPIAAKGDIISSNGTDNINLAVGTDTYVLTADSSQASGLKWVVPSSAPVSSVATKTGAVTLDWGDIVNGAGKYLTYKPNNTACNTNETLKFNGTNWVCSGSVTSVSGTAPISVATGTSTPVISITAGTTAGQALRWNGSAWASEFIAMTDLRSTVTGANTFATSCLANQTLTYNSVGDVMSCASIAIAATQITSGVLPVANGGTGTATGSITGTGALTFAAGGVNNDVTITPAGTGKTAIANLQLPSSGVIVSGSTACPGVGAITRDNNGDFYICK